MVFLPRLLRALRSNLHSPGVHRPFSQCPRNLSSSISPIAKPSLSSLFSAHPPPRSTSTKCSPERPEKKTLSSLFAQPPSPRPLHLTTQKPLTSGVAKPKLRKKRPLNPAGSTKKDPSVGVAASIDLGVSGDLCLLVTRLNKGGYLKEANFIKDESFDPGAFPINSYSQGVMKNAVERFGNDNQEIAKWLSGNHLKQIALLGCPSTDRKTIFAAKSLRAFFSIQEDTVCKACKMNTSCKFVNKKAIKEEKLILRDAMLVILGYIMPDLALIEQLSLSNDIKFSINKILNEMINLSS